MLSSKKTFDKTCDLYLILMKWSKPALCLTRVSVMVWCNVSGVKINSVNSWMRYRPLYLQLFALSPVCFHSAHTYSPPSSSSRENALSTANPTFMAWPVCFNRCWVNGVSLFPREWRSDLWPHTGGALTSGMLHHLRPGEGLEITTHGLCQAQGLSHRTACNTGSCTLSRALTQQHLRQQ